MEYLNFDLLIGTGSRRRYPISVCSSPGGEGHTIMRFPFSKTELKKRHNDLQTSLLRSGAKYRRIPSQTELSVQDFGQRLFDALFINEIYSCYNVSLQEALQQGKGLRLRLHIQAPELAALPWEFLYDSYKHEFVSFSTITPIIRYADLPQSTPLFKVDSLPLQILGLAASPSDLDSLDIEYEKELMQGAVEELEKKGLVKLTWLEGRTWRDLQKAMRGGPWHIFHYIGHGGFEPLSSEGYIVLEKENSRSHLLSASELSRILTDHRSLKLVVLNACEGARGDEYDVFSSTAATLTRGISSVLAMQYAITDHAAIEFARSFYQSLADGWPIDASVAEARKAISLSVKNTLEWGIPALYMRSPDGVLLDTVQKLPWVSQSSGVLHESLPQHQSGNTLPQSDDLVLKALNAHLQKQFAERDERETLVLVIIQEFHVDKQRAELKLIQLLSDKLLEKVNYKYQLTDKAKVVLAGRRS